MAGWQVKMLGSIAEKDDGGWYSQRSRLNGHTLVDWLREDHLRLGDVDLAGVLLSWLQFAAELDDSYGAEARLRALTEAVEVAVLELTAAARSSGEG